MVEDLPAWISAPLIAILGITMLYQYYILPGYEKDKEER